MTKILKSKYKPSRRFVKSVWGDSKDPVHVKNFRPGQHGPNGRVKMSSYGVHLQEKQIVKTHYGRISEKQFRNLYKLAAKKKGNTGENLAGLLEMRLDMVVYRLNLAPTIFAARQLVSHKNVLVNGKKVNIGSYRVQVGDVVSLSDKAKQMAVCMEAVEKKHRPTPDYLTLEDKAFSGTFVRVPLISDIPYPFQPNFSKIVEYYSR